MRIWDLNPGYLTRQSLLGEHRELHGIASVIRNNNKGYSRHPETLRWTGYGWGLKQRHRLLAAEMKLRGYIDRSPLLLRSLPGVWPENFVDSPSRQFMLLERKYCNSGEGRIPLPKNAQQLWAQHKYSVMARNMKIYTETGRRVNSRTGPEEFGKLALELTILLRNPPEPGLTKNALFHMWGYVSQYASISGNRLDSLSMKALLHKIQRLSATHHVKYLMESTALGELDAWEI